ncbi:MAG: Fis family transcriptional regulator [Deltaproteobacteria bacterium HGW-Deltaproteobacteria-14]|nr:MAG: Fis family transcriptional regulator [Deltaproteobacteria bacterium HGW-Deltaproteobacteria-14]
MSRSGSGDGGARDGAPLDSATITLESGALVGPPSAAGRLHLVHPPELAAALELGREAVVLGRRPPDPLGLVAHGTVSRQHLRIAWDGRSRAHLAADLGSHNGSWLDGAPLGPAATPLGDGAVLRAGGVVWVYETVPPGDPSGGDALAERIPGGARDVARLRAQIALAAPDPSPALIVGETGVGKEHVARALHDLGGRRGRFIAVNVSELSPQLVESQLFGHVRGAFTGADRAHDGLFRAAEGGTLFLDEIGELAPELQPKLLRALQEREVRPVGATEPRRVDVRVVAATLRDLARDLEQGAFRRDLYARLALWELRVGALRERRPDLMAWVARFHERFRRERKQPAATLAFEADAVEALLLAAWPDNLRGVDRLVHQLAHLAGGAPIGRDALAPWLDTTAAAGSGATDSPQTPERRAAPASREELEAALAEHGSVRALARWYGRDRRQIYRWLDAFGVPRGEA